MTRIPLPVLTILAVLAGPSVIAQPPASPDCNQQKKPEYCLSCVGTPFLPARPLP